MEGIVTERTCLEYIKDPRAEVGDATPSDSQIDRWINTNIHVLGRPEWVFVKAYTHGVQADILRNSALELTLEALERRCRDRGISLHYMTTREAYNLVKAEEDGHAGNPEIYRDYKIPKPCNMLMHTEVPVAIERVTQSEVVYTPAQ